MKLDTVTAPRNAWSLVVVAGLDSKTVTVLPPLFSAVGATIFCYVLRLCWLHVGRVTEKRCFFSLKLRFMQVIFKTSLRYLCKDNTHILLVTKLIPF